MCTGAVKCAARDSGIKTDGLIYFFFVRERDRPNLIRPIIRRHRPFAFISLATSAIAVRILQEE